MADSHDTGAHLHHAPEVPATEPQPEPSAAPNTGDIKVCIRPYNLDFWEYEGTRAQLEAEGVIPPGTEWPEGAREQSWEAGRFCYRLQRCRPAGMKGPMKLWIDGDWWNLRGELLNGPNHAVRRILDKKRELAEEIYRQTPAGWRESQVRWDRYLIAYKDKEFQTFKAKFIVPLRKKPGRPAKVRTVNSAQGAQA